MNETHEVIYKKDGGIASIILNRPEAMNAMNLTMRDELGVCFEQLRFDERVRAVVITGAGKAFCAGGDVNDFNGAAAEDLHDLIRFRSHRWFQSLWNLPQPTVAAVNGTAAGGGASLKAVLLSVKLIRSGFFDALVTAPVSKEAWALAGAPAPAHTDLFRLLEKREPLMLFSRGRVNAALVTEHVPLKELSSRLTVKLVKEKARLFNSALKALGRKEPLIALCALNPHAGDGGVIGGE